MLLALLAVGAAYGAFKISEARCFALVGDLVCRVETRERVVALSFDDGPTPYGVEHANAVLARHGIKATFFLIGRDMERHPDAVRRLRDAGHELANHSYSHRRMVARLPGFYDEEIARTDALLMRAGVAPRYFRPPYGKKLVGLPLAVDRNGHRMIMWDVEEDWGVGDPRAYADHIVHRVRPGSIVIMHVMYRANEVARQALPLVIEGLRARGYRIVPVGTLLDRTS